MKRACNRVAEDALRFLLVLALLLAGVLGSAGRALAQGDGIEVTNLTPAAGGERFGTGVTLVSSAGGNFIVTDPLHDEGGVANVGAIYVYDGATLELIRTLKGSNAEDRIGSGGITPLANGKALVRSPQWNGERGAATIFDATAGPSQVVSAANSLVGATPGDKVGSSPPAVFFEGPAVNHLLLGSPDWNGGRGALTRIDLATGTPGVVSAQNSLVGAFPNDGVGQFMTISLVSGKYLARTPAWNGGRGAVTLGDGVSGIVGEVSATNSLVGEAAGDLVGQLGLALANGAFVTFTETWSEDRGAVTWVGANGVTGAVSATNSLVGSATDDFKDLDIVALSNGNVVVAADNWNQGRGAVIWVSGVQGKVGTVSAANALVGVDAQDRVGGTVRALPNGNYVVNSVAFSDTGAVTWGNGETGIVGTPSAANSLVGTDGFHIAGGPITILANSNYVVTHGSWGYVAGNAGAGPRGAATFGNGATGIKGVISDSNSLIGSTAGDRVGDGVVALANGNYVVKSPRWNERRGAVTWGNGATGISGVVSQSNSLVGSAPGDRVGENQAPFAAAVEDGAIAQEESAAQEGFADEGFILGSNNPILLDSATSNYIILSRFWNDNRGAATWASGESAITGVVSASNSLVGANPGDRVGEAAQALTGGDYLLRSPFWNGEVGAITFANGSTGTTGVIGTANSLVGSAAGDRVGDRAVLEVGGGNYVLISEEWNSQRGAVTWIDGASARTGTVSASNSLVGAAAGDFAGGATFHLSSPDLDYYVIGSPAWSGGRGASTWASSATGITGVISASNSLVGTNPGDRVGRNHQRTGDNYLVLSPDWNSESGAVTWAQGSKGVKGVVDAQNSVLGNTPDAQMSGGLVVATFNAHQGSVIVRRPADNMVTVLRAPWSGPVVEQTLIYLPTIQK